MAELLPDLPSGGQANLVAGLWEVSHPGLIGLLTALGEHHHDPAVAKAARKAALKARSRTTTGPARQTDGGRLPWPAGGPPSSGVPAPENVTLHETVR